MSPLTLEKMTTPARLAAAPMAARWNQKTVADARDGGERARSGAGGRKRSVARGGALQNDDAVDDGDLNISIVVAMAFAVVASMK